MMKQLCVSTFLLVFFYSIISFSYPEFIGYGYTTCITCHYNGAGNGALNDYGRGLFATEIAGRPFWNSKVSDENLGKASGFFGAAELPWWFRPSYKMRKLSVTTDPTKEDKLTKEYNMQNDLNLAFLFSEEQKFMISYNLGWLAEPEYSLPNRPLDKEQLVTREHYLRWQIGEPWWIYLGFMDKTYGIRHADHTAVNRGSINIGQNDQVHGMVVQFSSEKHELFLNPYVGNLRADKPYIFPGVALTYEYEPLEKKRIGISVLSESNQYAKRSRFALIGKLGIGSGNSFLLETGMDTNQALPAKALTGAYAYAQGTINLFRGFNIQSVGQYSKSDVSKETNENLRWGLGILYFPFQRLELRVQAVTKRVLSQISVEEDTWSIQTQAHISL